VYQTILLSTMYFINLFFYGLSCLTQNKKKDKLSLLFDIMKPIYYANNKFKS